MRISDWSSDVCSSDLAYTAHLEDAPFQCLCAQCPCGFDSPEDRHEHEYEKHFICSGCDRVFYTNQARTQLQNAVNTRIECRSEESRVGKEGVRTSRSRRQTTNKKKNTERAKNK